MAAAREWNDVNTPFEGYQQAYPRSVLAVTSEERKLTKKGVAWFISGPNCT